MNGEESVQKKCPDVSRSDRPGDKPYRAAIGLKRKYFNDLELFWSAGEVSKCGQL